jgi:hypothetical protein
MRVELLGAASGGRGAEEPGVDQMTYLAMLAESRRASFEARYRSKQGLATHGSIHFERERQQLLRSELTAGI